MLLIGSRIDILLYLFAIGISLLVSFWMQKTFAKYSKIQNTRHISGREVAQQILSLESITDVNIVQGTSRDLIDNYNPENKVVTLSSDIYSGTTIASLSVAAHEIGHVIQHHKKYKFLNLRTRIVPIVGFSSQLIFPVLLLGMFTSIPFFYSFALVLLLIVLIFQVVTLPVEIDASKRALHVLKNNNFLDHEEAKGAKKVLTAAAFTYIAAVSVTLINLLRIFLYSDRRR